MILKIDKVELVVSSIGMPELEFNLIEVQPIQAIDAATGKAYPVFIIDVNGLIYGSK